MLTGTLLALAAMPTVAQSKLDMNGTLLLEEYQAERAQRIKLLGIEAVESEKAPEAGAIVMLNEGYTADCLEAASFTVTSDLGDIVLIKLPLDRTDELIAMPQVKSVSMGGKKRMLMNKARVASKVTDAHNGFEVDGELKKFDGTGVIVGLMDSGLDPNHVNFKDENGNSRVKRVWVFSGIYGSVKSYTSASSIAAFTTDDQQQTHGTHVAGIMAGSYNGTGKYYESTQPTNGNIPYYGVAKGAELAISCGDLYDDNIITGVEKVITYAESQGKPVAVNLSLGNNSGPHDGTDNFCQALDRLGERGIICIASGNEGDRDMSLEKTLTAEDNTINTFLHYNPSYTTNIDGILDIWASDDQPFTLTLSAYRTSNKTTTVLTTISSAGRKTISSSAASIQTGNATLLATKNVNNNRYNVAVSCNSLRMVSGYSLMITIEGNPGQKINLYFDGYSEFSAKPTTASNATPLAGYSSGSPDNSINSMAFLDNAIIVGSYTSRTTWYSADGQGGYPFGYGYNLNDITPFSSYGPIQNGVQKPDVCAPGAGIISSYSQYYVAFNDRYDYDPYGTSSAMNASATSNGVTHYWGEMEGTSMATPYVTGVMGLWLQANPNLTASQMRDILYATSINDSYTSRNSHKWGAGKIDAEAGLRKILHDLSSIGAVETDLTADAVTIGMTPGMMNISALGANGFEATLYSVAGTIVMQDSTPDDVLTLNTSHLTPGIYLVEIKSATNRVTKKVALTR